MQRIKFKSNSHFEDILYTFLHVTNCNWRVVRDHELILCSEIVYNEKPMHTKYLFL